MIGLILIRMIALGLNRCPEWVLKGICKAGGLCLYGLLGPRRVITLRSLAYTFPESTDVELRSLLKENCVQVVSMGLLALLNGVWSEQTIRERFALTKAFKEQFEKIHQSPEGCLWLVPHVAYMEGLIHVPLLCPGPKQLGVIYRPLNQLSLDTWVKRARERWGAQLLSRKGGIVKAMRLLENHQLVGVLFDQNAGIHGMETLLLDRPAYTTDLPRRLLMHAPAPVGITYVRSTGFLRGEVVYEPLPKEEPAAITQTMNDWLGHKLRTDKVFAKDWLWLHKRWDMKRGWQNCLNKHVAHSEIPEGALPRTEVIVVRISNWLGDVMLSVPLIRALEASRPDARIVILGKAQFKPLLERLRVGHAFETLPSGSGLSYWKAIRALKRLYPAIHILFTNSFRGDLESWLMNASLRLGVRRPNKPRPLLSHVWHQPPYIAECSTHQADVWEYYLKHFGLNVTVDWQPLTQHAQAMPKKVVFIAGSENSPEKRWPVACWQQVAKDLLGHGIEVVLVGTHKDKPITRTIAASDPRIQDLAGTTDLNALADVLQSASLVIGNDTGGLHLANALGVPVIALVGPTNPLRTGPKYTGKAIVLQPEDAEKTGGGLMSAIHMQRVLSVAHAWLGL